MKSVATRKKPPVTPAEWEVLIAASPGKDRLPTATEEEEMVGAVVVEGGGYAAVRSALAQKRKRGERGTQVAPTKQLMSVRYSPEVLQYFKATGSGWQTRMNEALLEWVNKRSTRSCSSRTLDPQVTDSLISLTRELSDKLYSAFDLQEATVDERTRLAAAMFDTTHEHHRAIALAVEAGLYGSALVLLRPMFESCINGLWLSSLATVAQVATFAAGARPQPKPERILRGLANAQSEHHAALRLFYDRGHKFLDEYVHSGQLQVSYRLGEKFVGSNYPPQYIENLLVHANWFALLAAIELASVANDPRLIETVAQIGNAYVARRV